MKILLFSIIQICERKSIDFTLKKQDTNDLGTTASSYFSMIINVR